MTDRLTGQTDRQTDRQTERRTDGQTDGQRFRVRIFWVGFPETKIYFFRPKHKRPIVTSICEPCFRGIGPKL